MGEFETQNHIDPLIVANIIVSFLIEQKSLVKTIYYLPHHSILLTQRVKFTISRIDC